MKTLFAAILPIFLIAFSPRPLHYKSGRSPQKSILNSPVPLQGTHWNLVELSNKRIPINATAKNMFLVLKSDSTVSGNGGCNAFSGNYSLGKDNAISFGDMVRTNILCPGIDFERKYLNALAKADHYTINGDTLSLQNQMVSLAKFAAGKK